ncbi:hypothetical protein QMK19_11905 [Streptomyces sp. H10-C2]|uniref:hypothetical protein n=1 Tax=unclassified Streptomyces TaxID=2593676 RepID=UPI0024B8E756|nr:MULTISPECIES: hypothetical protein [unclassified Streptomyces]MDJ0341884.1 hypothetical protein [Streptomyces sp. PH10-H1]MDJ0370362.1 hypothetical protein [Streptomyces sp. H10-C2]
MDGHRDLAQVLFAFAAVLHHHARGVVAVAHERVVVDQPRRRREQGDRSRRDSSHDLGVVPGGLGDEVAQVLGRDAQAGRHRLDRFAFAVEHQPT